MARASSALMRPIAPTSANFASLAAHDSLLDHLGALAERYFAETEVLAAVRGASFRFFERLVVELLVKMGYGGSLKDAGKAIGRSGDDGLDGVIKEDHLGLEVIYVQAKRWERTVGRPEIQAFAGSLEGVRGRKGVFITTSTFSSEAREYVSRIEKKIVLLDGTQLAALMTEHGGWRHVRQHLRGQARGQRLLLRRRLRWPTRRQVEHCAFTACHPPWR